MNKGRTDSLKRLKSFALLALLSPFSLVASDNPLRVEAVEHGMIHHAINRYDKEKRAPLCGFIFDNYPTVYFTSTVHWLAGVSPYGDSVEIEDGSVWRINNYDSYKALNWRSNDPLLITQNTRWFSSYNYKIVNRATGSSIEADLVLGPHEFGEFTRYIAFIDWAIGDIVMTDNTRWQISSYDTSLFSTWAVNDAIIVGYNSGWDSNCESILINVNMNNFIRAKQF